MSIKIEKAEGLKQFEKIKIWNGMATQIACFAVECGSANFLDFVDLKCGGIPDGSYEQLVDPEATDEFLSLYTQIAESRFAVSVSEFLRFSESYRDAIKNYCRRVGTEKAIPENSSLSDAYDAINLLVLDGMPYDTTKNIIENSETALVWEKVKDTHAVIWEKADGDLDDYYEMQECFIEGLLSNTKITFAQEDTKKFTLCL